ncbi:alanine--tRNA ligase, partial [bacterium]
MNHHEIRKKFIEFFKNKKHTVKDSTSLIPANDPSILFNSAGMVPFKDMFLGKIPLEYTRTVSIQKCVRTNDIENVGYTTRHLTFFEMMGNFSFGDYFKEDAIKWAWEFLTKELKISKDRLYITIYKDDNESLEIWKKIVPENKIYQLGKDSNFWSIGETGPCGPCSEILYDFGEHKSCGEKDCKPGCDCDRYMEIWNLVFTQFDKQKDGSMKPLPQKNIDTGMGLERLTAVCQNADTIFDTDLFLPAKKTFEQLKKDAGIKKLQNDKTIFHILADHARSSVFLLSDGITPSNEGRGYVLKRIIRRALRYGHKIGLKDFFSKITTEMIDIMKDIYPVLSEKQQYIEDIINNEENKFHETIESGLKLFDKLKEKYAQTKVIPGNEIFILFDTYGFPFDFAKETAAEDGYTIDENGFNKALDEQKKRARKNVAGWDEESEIFINLIDKHGKTDFVGYDTIETKSTILSIIKIISDNTFEEIKNIKNEKNDVIVVLDKTPFYAESGGQIGDKGFLSKDNNTIEIYDTKKTASNLVLHYGKATGSFTINETITASIDQDFRQNIKRNHTATHLLQAVLRNNLGAHIGQSGSLVTNTGFRFDFTHPKALSDEEIVRIESNVNNAIMNNYSIDTQELGIEEAKKSGALAFFGEKYGEKVRVVKISNEVSIEFCGGTHCSQTGEIGLFVITSETSIASG